MSLVAIVGRPNVGKSTLFNRLVGMRQAIVDNISGVTRDRHYGKCEWCGHTFSVVDTGGYTSNTEDVFEEEIRRQVTIAIEEADAVLFMVEVGTGITDFDEDIAKILRGSKKPVFLVVNKVDSAMKQFDIYEFYSLGLGEVWSIAAASGSGTGDLLDELVKVLPEEEVKENAPKKVIVNNNESNPDDDFEEMEFEGFGEINEEDVYETVKSEETQEVVEEVKEKEIPRVAIIGKPNVGKSSLTNALLGENRNIVTPIAGTTRDSIESHYNKFGHEFILVDTAGLRKKAKVTEDLEFYSVMRSIRAIENSDICILMIDAQTGIEAQDMAIFNLIIRNKKGCVIVVNKWDTIEKSSNTMKEFTEVIKKRIAPFTDIPIIFTSVINKQRILDVLDSTAKVYDNYARRIPTSLLNEKMLPEIASYPPPATKGKYVKIKFITQLPTASPSFAFFCNLPQYIKDPYKRYLENRLRSIFDFKGCPIQIYMRQK